MDKVKVSIIIPTYAGCNNIEIAVKSAINQTIKSKEIIVVDDNGIGTENQVKTEKKLKEFIDKKEIKYLKHNVNKNGSAARNTGLKASKGEYISFLDDDDYMFPDKIKNQLDKLEYSNSNVGFCVCSGYYVHKDGKGYIKKIINNENFLINYLKDKLYFNTSTLLIKRNAINSINGFDESFRRHQDWEFCTRLLSKYDACIESKPLIIKFDEGRNSPKTIEQRTDQLNFFFSKVGNIIKNSVGNKEFLKIKYYKYSQIVESYYLNFSFIKGIKYMFLQTNSIYSVICSFYYFISHIFNRITKGKKKVTMSYVETKKLLMRSK